MPKFDFLLIKKQQKNKIKNIPKREVTRQDLTLIKKVLGKVNSAPPKAAEVEHVYTTMQTWPKRPGRFKQLAVCTAGLLLVAFLLQTLTFLSSAKKSSGQILGVATTAYSDLDSASKNLESQNFTQATALFESAKNNLSQATNELSRFRPLTFIVPQAKSADHLLDGAYSLAQAGSKLSTAMAVYSNLIVSSKGIETNDFVSLLKQSRAELDQSITLLKDASSHFSQATHIPDEYAESLNAAKQQVALLTGLLEKILNLEDLYLAFFGDGYKTYLLVFQNHDEIRATGGFIGTYGVLKISNGKIEDLKIESVYNVDGNILESIAAPGPFQPEIKEWGMRDANWFIDFPTSAKKLLYFYESARETADGVMAFTPKVFEDVLTLVGPVDMPEYGVSLTAENFQEVVQLKTSVEYDKVLNQPKKFLSDFAPKLLDKLKNISKENWLSIIQAINSNFNQKNIILYSTKGDVQQKILDAGFAAEVKEAPHDYLAINNSNLGGTKNDLDMRQNAVLTTSFEPDGSIINKLEITRSNHSQQTNKSYMRVLVPLGSMFVNAGGFDVRPQFSSAAEGLKPDPDLSLWDQGTIRDNVTTRTEAGKTEFAGWVETKGVTSKTITLTYVLPFKIIASGISKTAPYSLLYQKQPGVAEPQLNAVWNLNSYHSIWNSYNLTVKDQQALINTDSKFDEYWSILLRE